jgi:hypothetical protein
MLFSPFFSQAAQVQAELERRARQVLTPDGIEISAGTLLISRLKIPDAIVSAYTDALAMGFSGAAQHELIGRLRDAGANMSDAGLVQLFNAIRNNPSEFNTIFTSGSFQPETRIQTGNASIQVPNPAQAQAPSTPPNPSIPPAGNPPQSAAAPTASANGASSPASVYRPLTAEDMALLKSVE